MLRTALQPRWLALLALVLLVCALFGWLGSWQLGVARDRGAQKAQRAAQDRPPVPVDQVLAPQHSFPATADARRVSATGAYDASRQVLVGERLQQGRPGWWVVTALRTDAGAWLPVVRGWVADPADPAAAAAAVPAGPVTVHGVLQPDDPPADVSSTLPDGQLAELDAADLVNRWGTPIYNGFVVLASERSAGTTAAQPVRVPAPHPQPQGLAWRNAAYAVQWWVFAGFALVLWGKMVQQDTRERAAAEERAAADVVEEGAP